MQGQHLLQVCMQTGQLATYNGSAMVVQHQVNMGPSDHDLICPLIVPEFPSFLPSFSCAQYAQLEMVQSIWKVFLSLTTSCQSALVISSLKCSLSTSIDFLVMRLTSASCKH